MPAINQFRNRDMIHRRYPQPHWYSVSVHCRMQFRMQSLLVRAADWLQLSTVLMYFDMIGANHLLSIRHSKVQRVNQAGLQFGPVLW